jgi:hypothetical protein
MVLPAQADFSPRFPSTGPGGSPKSRSDKSCLFRLSGKPLRPAVREVSGIVPQKLNPKLSLRNPHAEATTGVDLQVPAIMAYLERHGLRLQGTEVVDIGSWNGQASHAISIRLSPMHVKVTGDPKTTLEQFWQERKCLAVWEAT